MKLLQLNIWMGKLYKQIFELIDEEQPDILCLQEVFSSGEVIIKTQNGTFSILEFIKQRTGFQHSFFAPTYSMNLGGIKVDHGNAIISKYPLFNEKTIYVSEDYDEQLNLTEFEPNIRNLQTARVEIGAKSLTIANHHGYWVGGPGGDMGNETSTATMSKVVKELKTAELPLILAGDLNVQSESPAMRVFDRFLEDLTASHKVETTLSSLGFPKPIACDHILVSPGIKVNSFKVSDKLVSDHKALILEFEL